MLKFKRLTLDDIPIIKPYFFKSTTRTCDNTLGAAFMWRDYFDTEYAIYNDTLVFKVGDSAFTMPLGKNIPDILCLVADYCKSETIPMIISHVFEEDTEKLKKLYKTVLTFDRDISDYLYLAEDLAYMKGKKYSGPRNHINRFKRENENWHYEKINNENLEEVIEFYKELVEKTSDKGSTSFTEDQEKTFEVLYNYDKYEQTGLALYSGNKVIAFGIGEIIGDTLFEHIEKADTSYAGAYQMIASGFAKEHLNCGITYVNREDDAGDEGLRKSKLSYRPIKLLDKYTVKIIL